MNTILELTKEKYEEFKANISSITNVKDYVGPYVKKTKNALDENNLAYLSDETVYFTFNRHYDKCTKKLLTHDYILFEKERKGRNLVYMVEINMADKKIMEYVNKFPTKFISQKDIKTVHTGTTDLLPE